MNAIGPAELGLASMRLICDRTVAMLTPGPALPGREFSARWVDLHSRSGSLVLTPLA